MAGWSHVYVIANAKMLISDRKSRRANANRHRGSSHAEGTGARLSWAVEGRRFWSVARPDEYVTGTNLCRRLTISLAAGSRRGACNFQVKLGVIGLFSSYPRINCALLEYTSLAGCAIMSPSNSISLRPVGGLNRCRRHCFGGFHFAL